MHFIKHVHTLLELSHSILKKLNLANPSISVNSLKWNGSNPGIMTLNNIGLVADNYSTAWPDRIWMAIKIKHCWQNDNNSFLYVAKR